MYVYFHKSLPELKKNFTILHPHQQYLRNHSLCFQPFWWICCSVFDTMMLMYFNHVDVLFLLVTGHLCSLFLLIVCLNHWPIYLSGVFVSLLLGYQNSLYNPQCQFFGKYSANILFTLWLSCSFLWGLLPADHFNFDEMQLIISLCGYCFL